MADTDLDGRDEILDIGYGLKYDGTLAFNAGISHGDRFRTGDIDPERPDWKLLPYSKITQPCWDNSSTMPQPVRLLKNLYVIGRRRRTW